MFEVHWMLKHAFGALLTVSVLYRMKDFEPLTTIFGTESGCSKFHYEEQLLHKMVRLEFEMDQMKKQVENKVLPMIENLQMSKAMKPVPMIAFSAYEPAQIEYGDGPIIVFKSVLLNEGSSYDTSTGIFTAKVNGLYHFTVHVCNKPGNYAVVAIAHGGKRIAISTYYENTGSGCGSVSSLIKVGVGEQVNVISAYSGTKMLETEYRRASFMGVLVNV